MSKQVIWLPKAETKVTIEGDELRVWDEMVMRPVPVGKNPVGFAK